MKSLLWVFLWTTLLLLSCSSVQNKPTEIEKGVVVQKVVCAADTSVSYALYLPKRYSSVERYPLILAFDPHASGSLPVEKYISLAEKYNTILVGSNTSKNGLSFPETDKIINLTIEDIKSRFSVDTTQFYVMGFSGGARVASLVALYRGGVRGLIGCGAGIAGTNQPAKYRFDFIGFVGNGDFNLNEMQSLDEQLDQANFRHDLVIFDGKHEWPPVEVFEYAFLWNQFNKDKDQGIQPSMVQLADFKWLIEKELRKVDSLDNLHRKADAFNREIHFLKGIENCDQVEAELSRLKEQPQWKAEEAKMERIRQMEMNEQNYFLQNFYSKDLPWWKEKIASYNKQIEVNTDRSEVLMYMRIKAYLSLLAYMNYSNSKNAGTKERVTYALEVYQIVDPENAAKIK